MSKALTILGDFRQCLPVVPKASRAQIVAATVSNAVFWKDVIQLKLHTNMRLLSQANQMNPKRLRYTQTFSRWLLDIGNGEGNSMLSDKVSLPERKLSTNI